MSAYEPDDQTRRPRGMSTATKVIILLGCLVGVMCLACCAGMYYFGKQVAEGMTQDPARVRQIADSILDVQPPEGFAPQAGMEFGMFQAGYRMAIFSQAPQGGLLMLMEISVPNAPPGAAGPAGQPQFPPQQPGMGRQAQPAVFIESEEHQVVINGQNATFRIGRAKNDQGQEVMQVTGDFLTKGKKSGALVLMGDPATLSKEKAIDFVKSLGPPVDGPAKKDEPNESDSNKTEVESSPEASPPAVPENKSADAAQPE